MASCARVNERARAGKPARIISLSPNTTEILEGVGAFPRVVAVSDYCKFPPEAARLPKVGGWNNPNLEQIASLRPDLVVFSEPQAQFVQEKIEAMGIKTLAAPGQTIEDAYASIERVGRATGDEEAARRLVEQTRGAVEEVRARTSGLPRRRVLCVVDRVPGTLRDIYTAAPGSFIAQLIEAAGGEPVSPPSGQLWGKMQKEAVVALDPDVVIDLMMQPEGRLAEDSRAVWDELSTLRAVREGRVHALREETLLHPSQFVGDTARRFAEIIHPEAFGKK
jgi:iron complex transport system substrate-binding protein